MKNNSKISIPLISFSSGQKGWDSGNERGEKIFLSNNYIRISPPMELQGECYGVRIEDTFRSPILPLGSLAIFSKTEANAVEDIYAVGVERGLPFIGKWMQKESLDGNTNRRKVFMVPTPMHHPDSKVSPIAESLHKVLMFKEMSDAGKMKLVPEKKLLWKHPLIYVEEEGAR